MEGPKPNTFSGKYNYIDENLISPWSFTSEYMDRDMKYYTFQAPSLTFIHVKPLGTKLCLSDLKTQSVPRSKYSLPRL
jgi:hypothetical protein